LAHRPARLMSAQGVQTPLTVRRATVFRHPVLVMSKGKPRAAIRIDPALWDRFAEVAEPDRSTILREFIAWYVREPGAKLPRRPAE
jgi:hypothetical protein